MNPASPALRFVQITGALLSLISVSYSSVEWFSGDLLAWTNVVTSCGIGMNLAGTMFEPTLGRKLSLIVGCVGMLLAFAGFAAHFGHVRLSPPTGPR
jgi:hypothetical protein